MGIRKHRTSRRSLVVAVGAAALAALAPATASAQFASQDRLTPAAIGENYHVELSGSFWNPTPFGVISAGNFEIVGSSVDFVGDLGFQQTRFKDVRIVLRPSRKSRFRV